MKAFPIVAIPVLILLLTQCSNNTATQQPLTPAKEKEYLEKGKTIASATFTELSGKLTSAMQAGGVTGAVKYCNLAAMPLVDSLSKANNASIRRTSMKTRNPLDKPSEWESEILSQFQEMASKGEELKPRVQILEDGKVAFSAPIMLQPLCTKCHGMVGTDISDDDYAVIKQLYPEDEAVGYKPGELRGMWSIVFER